MLALKVLSLISSLLLFWIGWSLSDLYYPFGFLGSLPYWPIHNLVSLLLMLLGAVTACYHAFSIVAYLKGRSYERD